MSNKRRALKMLSEAGAHLIYRASTGSLYFTHGGMKIRLADHSATAGGKMISINYRGSDWEKKLRNFLKPPSKLGRKDKNGIILL